MLLTGVSSRSHAQDENERMDVSVTLDAKEAAGDAYRRRSVEVLCGGERAAAVAYEVIRKEPHEVAPTRAYLDTMLTGIREHGLPEAWLQRIEAEYYTF